MKTSQTFSNFLSVSRDINETILVHADEIEKVFMVKENVFPQVKNKAIVLFFKDESGVIIDTIGGDLYTATTRLEYIAVLSGLLENTEKVRGVLVSLFIESIKDSLNVH